MASKDEQQQCGTDKAPERRPPLWMFWKRRRYMVSILAFFGFFNIYSLRVNFSIAIVAMTEKKAVLSENGTITFEQEFDWDSKLQGYLLSSFFYGYITTQLLGGWLSARIGGKRVFATGIGVTAIFTLLTPWLVTTNVYLFLAVRVIEGVFEGVTFPSIHAVWARWAPPLERTRLATIAFSGSFVGTVVAMPLSAYLSTALGWPSIFYFFGSIALIWCAFWWILVAESPDQDSRISQRELAYITRTLGKIDSKKKVKHPWTKIFTSLPFYAITMSHFSENWGFYTLLTQLPKFMKDVLDFDLGQSGFLSGVPYLVMFIVIQISGYFADWFRERGILTTTQVRKIFNCGAFLAQTIFMMAAAYIMSPVGTTTCLTLAVGLGGFAWSGFSVNYLDIAPQHASVLMGLGNTWATIPGIISPIISGYIVTTPTAEEWQVVFFITSGVYLFGCIIYAVFASGELQPWAMDTSEEKENPTQEEAVAKEKENPIQEETVAKERYNQSFLPD